MRARRRISLLILLAVATAGAPACARRRAANQSAESRSDVRTMLRVENLSFPDMTIYVLRGGSQRIRVGQAGGNRTTMLEIPSYLVQFPVALRFIADPIGSSRAPVSDEITVNPGEEVVLTIPPG